MPLRCIDPETGKSIYAFDLVDAAWAQLRALNRRYWHLRTSCCGKPVVLKQSKLGTRFFAHKHDSMRFSCVAARETEDHLRLKRTVLEIARSLGWKAETEVVGDGWRADVLASKGEDTIAIEVQLSRQSDEETLRRQACLAAAGIRGLWFFRQQAIPHHPDIPAVKVSWAVADGDTVTIPFGDGKQIFPLSVFLEHFFAERFGFGVPVGSQLHASVSWSTAPCWHCRRATSQMTQLTLRVGELTGVCDHRIVARYQSLMDEIGARVGVILRDTNRCNHCGTHIGNFSKLQGPNAVKSTEEFQLFPDSRWLGLLSDPDCGLAYWTVRETQ